VPQIFRSGPGPLCNSLGIDKDTFYDPKRIAILPMGFCYPGSTRSGDKPPRRECAQAWRDDALAMLTNVRLTVVLGKYAQDWHLDATTRTVTAAMLAWRDYWPEKVPLPHPSPRNQAWFKKNAWFEQDLLPALRQRVHTLIGSDDAVQ
jgi:uracil-DNA glycosylase